MVEKGELVKAWGPALEVDETERVRAAKDLQNFIKQNRNKLVQNIGGKEHLAFEAWAFLGARFGVGPTVESVEPIFEDDPRVEIAPTGKILNGFNAVANLVRLDTGELLNQRAQAECTRDEPNWAKKPSFQLKSMAQTRACSKALRLRFSPLVVMAGYEPTPKEEMTGEEYGESTSVKPTQRQNERSDPRRVVNPKAEETPTGIAPDEATEGNPAKPSAAKPENSMSAKQEGLLRAILNSHVFSAEERQLIEAEIPIMNRFKASKRIDQLRKEAEKRKKAEPGKASAAFDDPSERPSYLSVIEKYLQAEGQDDLVKSAGELRLKRIREGTDKPKESSLIEWIRNLHYNLTNEVITEADVQKRIAKNDFPWSGGE